MGLDEEKFGEIKKKISLLKLNLPEQEYKDTVKKLGIRSPDFTNGLPEYRPIKKQSDDTSASG